MLVNTPSTDLPQTKKNTPAQTSVIPHMLQYFLSLVPSKSYTTTPKTKQTIESLWRLEKIILDSLDFTQVVQKICDSVLTELGYLQLGYRIVVLALLDEEKLSLKRVSISQTDEAKKALQVTPVPFYEITIPISAADNFCIKTLKEGRSYTTHDWIDILCPPYTPDEARRVQQIVGIKTSVVYPVIYHGKAAGVLIFSMIKDETEVSDAERDLIQSFTDVVGLAVQNAKLFTSLEQTTKQLGETNEKLKDANEKLQELDKLKDEFVSLASHELRTPMTAIKGSLSTILEGYAGEISKESREFLTAAYNENDRLIRLVNNLLNISRIEAGRFTFTITKVNMEKIITEVVKSLQPAATERAIFLKYEKDGVVPYIYGDEDKVKEVLINLVGNATKFTHKGGITVRTKVKDTMLITSVTDTGSGIAPEDIERLFKKFSQVGGNYARPTGGTGLGLYISKQIVEGQMGKIWLESTVDVGTTFFFSLPIASDSV